MEKTIYLCIDDTDTEVSIGTGRVARHLSERIEKEGLGKVKGITRHQLLLDEKVPYTANNGNACLKVVNFDEKIYEFSVEFMKSNFVPGSDPGICICPEEMITSELVDFGHMAQQKVLSKNEAYELAHKNGIFLKELGGDGQGVIGALAGVGLRFSGNDGRFIELDNIRNVVNKMKVKEILERTPIESVVDLQGNELSEEVVIEPLGWLRPCLRNGKPVLIVGGPIAKGIEGNLEGVYIPVKL